MHRARQCGLRFLAPKYLGVIGTRSKFNGIFSEAPALPGRLAVVSQSGAPRTAILDAARDRGVGFCGLISTGIGADVEFGEILDCLARDPETGSLL